jgi:hypothetical protein
VPLPILALQPAKPVIAFLAPYAGVVAVFRQGLSIEGKNVAIEYRWAEGQYERLPALARELVNRKGFGDCCGRRRRRAPYQLSLLQVVIQSQRGSSPAGRAGIIDRGTMRVPEFACRLCKLDYLVSPRQTGQVIATYCPPFVASELSAMAPAPR